jgi:hypothetical protein
VLTLRSMIGPVSEQNLGTRVDEPITPPSAAGRMSPLATGSGLTRLSMWLCLALLAICLCLARTSQTRMDDDNLYLAYAAQSDVARAAPLEQSLIERIAPVPGCETSAYRLAFRQRYTSNYVAYTAVQRAVQHAATWFVPPGPKSVVLATLVVKGLFLLLICVALGVVAVRGANPEIEAAVVCAFIALVALELATSWVPTPPLVDIVSLPHTLAQLFSSFFIIVKAHSDFEVTPRNGALLLFVIALVLKWQGRLTPAVLALLLITLLHQTYAGLALILFAACSAVSKPEIFATTLHRAILVGMGLVYVVREHFLEHLEAWVQIVCALALVVAALLFFRIVGSARYAALRQRCLGSWLEREVVWDAVIQMGFLALVTLASWVGNQLTHDAMTRRFVWSNLPIRSLSFVRFPVFVACFWLVLTHLPWLLGRGRSWLAATCALSCLALSWVFVLQVDPHVSKRLGREVGRHLSPPRDRRIFSPRAEENRIYAHLTMVAAGQMEADAADKSIVANRRIKCSSRH